MSPYRYHHLCYIESTGELQAAEVGSIPTCDREQVLVSYDLSFAHLGNFGAVL